MTSWLRRFFERGDRIDTVEYPSAQFATQVDAIAALLDAVNDGYEWASIDAREKANVEWLTVQVSRDQINTLIEPIDLIGVLRQAGLSALAEIARPADEREQRRSQAVEDLEKPVAFTLYNLPGATNAELAETVHAVFRHHYGLSPMYEVVGRRAD